MLSQDKQRDLGLLILRLGVGASFMAHGWPKILGGPSLWHGLGSAVGNFGIHFLPTFFGLMAALSEFGGGLCLVLGAFLRPACALMFITMVVASEHHLAAGEGFGKASHAMELAVVFLSLLLLGGGNYRVRIGR